MYAVCMQYVCMYICMYVHVNIGVHTYVCSSPSFCLQACANIIIFAATNLVGVCYNLISDTAQRKSFSETRRFIRSLIAIGLENKKVVSGGEEG